MHDRRKTCASHNFTVLGVVIALGLVAVMGTLGLFVLAFYEHPIPGELIGMVTGAIVGLPALLARVETAGVQPVTVENPPSEPVPVERTDVNREEGP